MKVLVVKTSSLGDVIHTLPAVTDAAMAVQDIHFDWVVEEAYTEVPAWHPAVHKVIPIGLRRWRKSWRQAWRSRYIQNFMQALRQDSYDLIIDAQGLCKSAVVALMAKGDRAGFDRHSAREPWIAWTYQQQITVPRKMHAIERVRRLFAQTLDYPLQNSMPDYGIFKLVKRKKPLNFSCEEKSQEIACAPYLVFLHGTTWSSKLWPDAYWLELAAMAVEHGYHITIPWGNRMEHARAEKIAAVTEGASILPLMSLTDLAYELAAAAGVVGVDTGLIHLAAALEIPAVTLYGATSHKLTGAKGSRQRNLVANLHCAPCLKSVCEFQGAAAVTPACYAPLTPAYVLDQLLTMLDSDRSIL